jgi:hypothetical protein
MVAGRHPHCLAKLEALNRRAIAARRLLAAIAPGAGGDVTGVQARGR